MQNKRNYSTLVWPFNLIADIEGRREMKIEPIEPLPEDFNGSLEYVLHSLPCQKNVEVLRLRYQCYMTHEEISKEVGLSQPRVAQMLEYVRREMRKPYWTQYLRYGVQGVIEQQQQQQEIYQQKVESEVLKAVEADRHARIEAEAAERYVSLPMEDRILLEELNLDMRAKNCLRRGDIKTVGDLMRLDYQTFAKIRSLGEKTRMRIRAEVEKLGFDCSHLKEPIKDLTE